MFQMLRTALKSFKSLHMNPFAYTGAFLNLLATHQLSYPTSYKITRDSVGRQLRTNRSSNTVAQEN